MGNLLYLIENLKVFLGNSRRPLVYSGLLTKLRDFAEAPFAPEMAATANGR
jgi:hypothetical protein